MSKRGKGRVLLAEDNEELAMALAALLRQNGYSCTCARDVEEALQALEARPHDLLLCDLRLPGRDGMALIREVRAKSSGLPVVLLTGFPSVKSAVEAVQLGVAAYLVKPHNFRELFELVEREVARYRAFLEFQNQEQQLKELVRRLRSEILGMRDAPEPLSDRGSAAGSSLEARLLLDELEELLRTLRKPSSEALDQGFDPARLEAALRHTVSVIESARLSLTGSELNQIRRHLEGALQRN